MKRLKNILLIGFAALLVPGLAACGKTDAVVTVRDRGVVTELTVGLPETVGNILTEAEITLKDGDEVSPAAESEMTEAGEITVSRKNTVTLTVDGESREVVMIGGTVQDLLDREGIVPGEDLHLEQDPEAWLTDGMEIVLNSVLKISVTADGKTEEKETGPGTVGEVLERFGITLGTDDRVTPAVDEQAGSGMQITVSRVTFGEETGTEEIDFETTRQDDPTIAKGEETVSVEGQKGEKTITWKVTYVDGTEESREVISEEVTKEPVNEVILVGTMEAPVYTEPAYTEPAYTEPQNTAPAAPYETGRVAVPNCADGSHGYYEIYWSDGSVTYEEY